VFIQLLKKYFIVTADTSGKNISLENIGATFDVSWKPEKSVLRFKEDYAYAGPALVNGFQNL
jgi:hypothetical protein